MVFPTSPPIAIIAFAVSLLGAAGCSRITLAYNTAQFFTERFVKDYLDLSDSQVSAWNPELRDALAQHRGEELPFLARFFDTALKGAENGFNKPRMQCLIAQLESLYQRHLRTAVALVSPLLDGLTPDQIRALEQKFREESAEDKADADPASVARRERKRTERYQESISWWIGPLTPQQEEIVREQTAAMPSTAAAWLAYRSAMRDTLIEILKRRAGETEIRRFLDAWLVDHRDLPPDLRAARGQIGKRITELFLRMDESFSAEQRAHFVDRLATLRDDFISLQVRPRMASVKCADTG